MAYTMNKTMRLLKSLIAILVVGASAQTVEWKPAQAPLFTKWARFVNPDRVHPEYPRPQLVRTEWLNLNGLWDLAILPKESSKPENWPYKILVPFPIESALSGIGRQISENERLWYRRTFELPPQWQGKRIILHFGAVDWEADLWVNGQYLGKHRGGYDPFSFDITKALKPDGIQEIIVAVWDPTDAGYQPRGKQVRKPGGIWYTSTTGIWQSVWLEPVNQTFIKSIRLTPDIDKAQLIVEATIDGTFTNYLFEAVVFDNKTPVSAARTTSSSSKVMLALHIAEPKLWWPHSPFLYDLQLTVRIEGRTVDTVSSYFGMRKVHIAKDREGIPRIFLNNKPYFMFGPLDQGFWPDGLYTAPTDEALRYDIEVTKMLGFNMCRKHVKVEPQRWYYWADKLGLLVWQDMPNGDRHIGHNQPDIERSTESAQQFLAELKAMIDSLYNHPSIVMWIAFNEGWGQWNTAEVVRLIKEWDTTRLVNNASGWVDRGVGDVIDIHSYPGPDCPNWDNNRAAVLGEFGGLGLPIEGHLWQKEGTWGYRSYKNPEELFLAYKNLIERLPRFIKASGLSAAVYTQTTDVEVEVNGLMTYDREIIKMGVQRVRQINEQVYKVYETHDNKEAFYPPAIPLIVCDPYFSIWSFVDYAYDDYPRHWTGRTHALVSLVRIDGKVYRLLGIDPAEVPPLPQKSVEVLPTRTIYTFEGAGVQIKLSFMTPTIPFDIDLLSRPVGYITWEAVSIDGRVHDLSIYFDNTAELAVNEPSQEVDWELIKSEDLIAIKFGTTDQLILAKSGDDLRIDWGYAYSSAPLQWIEVATVAPSTCRRQFALEGTIPSHLDTHKPRAVQDNWPVAAFILKMEGVSDRPIKRWIMLAYDDIYSIQYMGHNLRPYWRRNGWDAIDLLQASYKEYEIIEQNCKELDEELIKDAITLGGEKYAKIVALAFRQAFGANKFVADKNGQPLSFSKECFSNGCIGTVDVIYPMSPLFFLFGPSIAKSMLVPVLNYASSERWKFPFAPHDLGTYPLANGQVYGGGEHSEENQMPVEESGNMLIMLAAIAKLDGNAEFVSKYWKVIKQWADYLLEKGFDPENQLCTDDFAGHLAHNVNLSAKAICGLASFAYLAELRGEKELASSYMEAARTFAKKWIEAANDGDQFRLAFDRAGTWSQKYNLVWDKILGFNLWPDWVREKEMKFYKKVLQRYGLPLDNRSFYTKLDWILWTATLTQNQEDFQQLINPVYRFLTETPDRIPMTDWYWTHNGRVVGFRARPVVGGVFLQFLYHPELWQKYASKDKTKASNWAPMPLPVIETPIVPTAETHPTIWRYTTRPPGTGWEKVEFDDSGWQEGISGFGTKGTPGAIVGTVWASRQIWLRKSFELKEQDLSKPLYLRIHHDEDVEVYINGQFAIKLSGYTTRYHTIPLKPQIQKLFKIGKNVIAVYCRQTTGGQYIDVGFVHLTSEQ